MIGDYPTKEVNAPYVVQPNDLGLTLVVKTAGDITFGALLNAANPRFSIIVVNASSGAMQVKTSGPFIRRDGRLPAVAAMTLPVGGQHLMMAVPGSLDWAGVDLTSPVPAPGPSPAPGPAPAPAPGTVAAYLTWGGGVDTLNGGAWNANPTLNNGSTFPFLVHITNPLNTPLEGIFTEVYIGASAGTNFGTLTIPANSTHALAGALTVSGTIGQSGYIRLTVTDIYGSTTRADLPFVIGGVSSFTASINNGYTSSVVSGAPRNLGARTCTPTGGTGPYTYLWEVVDAVWTDETGEPTYYFQGGLINNASATLFVQSISTVTTLTGTLRCTVTDFLGNVAVATRPINVSIS